MQKKHPLAVWREKQDPPLSQDEFAKRLGVNRWTVNSIETGRRNASLDMVDAVSGATGGEVGLEQLRPDITGRFPTPNQLRAS